MKTYIKNLAKKIASQQIEIESLKSLNFFFRKKNKIINIFIFKRKYNKRYNINIK